MSYSKFWWMLILLAVMTACAGPTSTPPATAVWWTPTVTSTATAMPFMTPILLPALTPISSPTATVTPAPPPATATPAWPAGVYRAQSGDTLTGVAARFRVVTQTLLALNPGLPLTQTFTPGVLVSVSPFTLTRAYSLPLLPDSAVVYAPGAANFDIKQFVLNRPGFLATYTETLATDLPPVTGWELVDEYARSYAVSPRLLLALLEYQSRALTDPAPAEFTCQYPLGAYSPQMEEGLSHQLGWAGNQLSYGYYGWRSGQALLGAYSDGGLFSVAPTLNAGSYAVMWVLGQLHSRADFSPERFLAVYQNLFGDPWAAPGMSIPGGLTQPLFQLPFEPHKVWAFTGGPHPAYGHTFPLAALDFAPPAAEPGCAPSPEWLTAVHDGRVIYSGTGRVELDVGDGWTVVYFHVATPDRIAAGQAVRAGDRLGHPGCEGGESSGTHVHLARQYNGEWIPADGFAPFELSGWVAQAGAHAYQGVLVRAGQVITACACANSESHIQLDAAP